jgi:hypothetical protein
MLPAGGSITFTLMFHFEGLPPVPPPEPGPGPLPPLPPVTEPEPDNDLPLLNK